MFGVLATALAIGVAGVGDAVGGSALKPSLRLMSRQPLTIHGWHFASRERVRVQLSGSAKSSRSTRADASGAFNVKFDDVTVTRCNTIRVVAVGGRGSRAILKMLPSPACLPA
jgi:hypothetical protein